MRGDSDFHDCVWDRLWPARQETEIMQIVVCRRCWTFQGAQRSGVHRKLIETLPILGFRLMCTTATCRAASATSAAAAVAANQPLSHTAPTSQVGRRIFSLLQFVTVSILWRTARSKTCALSFSLCARVCVCGMRKLATTKELTTDSCSIIV